MYLTDTCCQVVPSTPLYDLPHALIIRSSQGVSEDKNEEEVDIIAEIHKHGEEPEFSVGKKWPQNHFSDSQESAGDWSGSLLGIAVAVDVL